MKFYDVSAPKTYFRGTHRSVAPAETLRRFVPRLGEMGITRLADITGLDCVGLPVYVAVRPASRNLSTSQGKGFDHDSAKASAMMESIESWHAERTTHLPLVHESYRELRRTHAAVDPLDVAGSAGSTPRQDVPYVWARGWDLMNDEWAWVPHELVMANFVFPPGFRPTFSVTSNGLASGNHSLEAIVHALCEVIERDAHSRWGLREPDLTKRARVDLSTVEDGACRQVLELLERAGIGVVAWEMTSDVGVPAYACQIAERPDQARWRPIGPSGGFGCHLSPAVALMRALTEAVQSRLTFISGSRDDVFYRSYDAFGDRDNIERGWSIVSKGENVVPFDARAAIDTPTFEGEVARLLERLRGIGVTRVVVVDLTRTEIGIPVVKVIVPGLEAHSAAATYKPGARAARVARA